MIGRAAVILVQPLVAHPRPRHRRIQQIADVVAEDRRGDADHQDEPDLTRTSQIWSLCWLASTRAVSPGEGMPIDSSPMIAGST